MKTILKAIEVDSPVHRVYNQWTRFEDFPRFMQGVKKVILLDDQRLQWETEFSGTTKEWYATITDLTPDQRIAWESEDGEYVAGIVTFEPIGTSRTRLNLKLFYDSKGSRRSEGEFLSSAGDRVEEDLQRFRKFIEDQDREKNGARGVRGWSLNPPSLNRQAATFSTGPTLGRVRFPNRIRHSRRLIHSLIRRSPLSRQFTRSSIDRRKEF
jgi:uncharacterized protein YndB with AHSA1/START domain